MKPAISTLLFASIVYAYFLTGCGGNGIPNDPGHANSSSSSSASSSSSSSSSTSASSSSGTSGNPIREKFVGNIPTRGAVRTDFIEYWDQITSDTEGRWTTVESVRDVYEWQRLDKTYQYAREHNIPVKASGLISGGSFQHWLGILSAEEQRAEIEEWIHEYCSRYPNTPMIEVVKGALPSHNPPSYARNAFGENWLTEVFKLARQHCPDSILIYDDNNFLTWDTDGILELIRPAVEAGVVDALSMQAHGLESSNISSAQELKDKLDLIGSLGTKLYISEYDIDVADDQAQLQYMHMHFPIFYEHPQVAGITLYGYIYGSTWRDSTGLIREEQPRPAMNWLMEYLQR